MNKQEHGKVIQSHRVPNFHRFRDTCIAFDWSKIAIPLVYNSPDGEVSL